MVVRPLVFFHVLGLWTDLPSDVLLLRGDRMAVGLLVCLSRNTVFYALCFANETIVPAMCFTHRRPRRRHHRDHRPCRYRAHSASESPEPVKEAMPLSGAP